MQRLADGTRQFDGGLNSNNVPVDFAGYQLRVGLGTGLTWEQLLPLHTGLITQMPFETNQLAAGTYTAGIKAVDTTGNVSRNAILIQSTLGDPRISNAFATQDPRITGWQGIKINCYVNTETGNLLAKDTQTWASLAGTTWAAWTSWVQSPYTTISYEHIRIDAEAIVNMTPLVTVTANGVVTIEESHSDDDITYTAFTLVSGQLSARYIKIKVTVVNTVSTATISQMLIVLDAELTAEIINDLNTASLTGVYRIGIGNIRLPITKNYAVIKTIQIALQNTGAGWTWEIVDKDVTVGPNIKIYNASMVLADAVIDANITGV